MRSMTFVATGDALITRRVTNWGGDAYQGLLQVIRSADARFTNLEALLGFGDGYPAADSGGTYIVAPAGCLDDLVQMGFNLFSRANNHAGDWSHGGVLETSRVCDAAGVAHAGCGANLAEARRPAYLDLAAGKVALLSVTSTLSAAHRAGTQRPDCTGRPGASFLRFHEYAVLPEAAMARLKEIAERTGLEPKKQARVKLGFARPDPEGVFTLGDLRFRQGSQYGEASECHQGDLEEILRYVRDARRQADWVLMAFHGHEQLGAQKDSVPDFHRQFARACIDAGCDAVIGHGPHLLRGMEMYKGRPIFYSLGNFIFQNEQLTVLPADFYEKLGLDPIASTPADAFDARTRGGTAGFPADRLYWESVLPWWRMVEGETQELRLYPVQLGFGLPRSQRGRPLLATGELAVKIIADMDRLSRPFGVEVRWNREGYGEVRW